MANKKISDLPLAPLLIDTDMYEHATALGVSERVTQLQFKNAIVPPEISLYDGFALDFLESSPLGAAAALSGGVGWGAAGVVTGGTIVSRTTHGGAAQNRLSLTGPGEFGRKMPWAGKWNALRLGLLIRINGLATFDSQFSLGVCSGTTLMFGAGTANCLNSVSVCQFDTGASDDFTFSTGTQNTIFVSSSYEGVRRTGGSDTGIGGSFTTAKMTAPANEPSLACFMVDITRPVFAGGSSVQYAYNVFAPNTAGNTEWSVTRNLFQQMMLAPSGTISSDFTTLLIAAGASNFSGTTSETPGVFDTMNFWWQNAANPIEIAAYGVRKYQ
jgi:hypothetical protein